MPVARLTKQEREQALVHERQELFGSWNADGSPSVGIVERLLSDLKDAERERDEAWRKCAEIVARNRRQIELSSGVGSVRQKYGLAVCDEIAGQICAAETFKEARDAH